MTLTVLRNTSKVFCRGPHGYNLPDVFPMSWQGLWVLGKKNPEVKCHCHHIISRVHRTQSLPLIVNLTIWPGLSLSVPPPHLFYTLLLGRSHNAKPHTIRIKNYTPPAWRHIIYINYFYFFCIGYLCILPLLLLPGKSQEQWSLTGCSPWRSQRVRQDLATKQQQEPIESTWLHILKVNS